MSANERELERESARERESDSEKRLSLSVERERERKSAARRGEGGRQAGAEMKGPRACGLGVELETILILLW